MHQTKIIFSLLLALTMASCKPTREKLIARKWQETGIDNPEMQAAMLEQQHFIDTVGTHTSSSVNIDMYGTANMDSLKNMLQLNLNHLREMTDSTMRHTQYQFMKRGVVYMYSDDGVDSASWYFEEDNGLVLDEMKLKGAGGRVRMEILALSDSTLQLQYTENNTHSVAIFSPAKK